MKYLGIDARTIATVLSLAAQGPMPVAGSFVRNIVRKKKAACLPTGT